MRASGGRIRQRRYLIEEVAQRSSTGDSILDRLSCVDHDPLAEAGLRRGGNGYDFEMRQRRIGWYALDLPSEFSWR